MLVTDEIIQCPRVCVHLQTKTGVSGNANVCIGFTTSIYIYTWFIIIPHYIGCCYNNKIKLLNRKVKNNKINYDSRTNHLWGPPVSIQMQCLFLIKLLIKRKIKLLKKKIYISFKKENNKHRGKCITLG
jgi:hypothetical protein